MAFSKTVLIMVITLVLLETGVGIVSAQTISKTTGSGWFKFEGDKWGTTWAAQIDNTGNVKGQAQAQFGDWGSYHAEVTSIIIDEPYAFVGGALKEWDGQEICFCVYDGGKDEADKVTAWYGLSSGPGTGAAYCQEWKDYIHFFEIMGGNAKIF